MAATKLAVEPLLSFITKVKAGGHMVLEWCECVKCNSVWETHGSAEQWAVQQLLFSLLR